MWKMNMRALVTHTPAQGSLRLPGPARLRGVKVAEGGGVPASGPSLVWFCPADLSATPAAAGNASAADTWWGPDTYTLRDTWCVMGCSTCVDGAIQLKQYDEYEQGM